MKKLTAYECYKIKLEYNLSDEDYKKLLIENQIIIPKDVMSVESAIKFAERYSELRLDPELMMFGNWLLRQEYPKLYVRSGLDETYVRMPMKDILAVYRKSEIK